MNVARAVNAARVVNVVRVVNVARGERDGGEGMGGRC